MVRSEGLGCKREYNMCGKKILETTYNIFLPWHCLLLYMLYFKICCVYCCSCLVCTVVVILCEFVVLCVYCCFLLWMPDCWLEVSIRKVLRPATSTQVFLVLGSCDRASWNVR